MADSELSAPSVTEIRWYAYRQPFPERSRTSRTGERPGIQRLSRNRSTSGCQSRNSQSGYAVLVGKAKRVLTRSEILGDRDRRTLKGRVVDIA